MNLGTSQFLFRNLRVGDFQNVGKFPFTWEFPKELEKFPDVWEFGKFQRKQIMNFPNYFREYEWDIFSKFGKFPLTWKFGEFPKELGTSHMSMDLGNSFGKFPKKRNKGTSQIPFGNLRGYIFKFYKMSLRLGI